MIKLLEIVDKFLEWANMDLGLAPTKTAGIALSFVKSRKPTKLEWDFTFRGRAIPEIDPVQGYKYLGSKIGSMAFGVLDSKHASTPMAAECVDNMNRVSKHVIHPAKKLEQLITIGISKIDQGACAMGFHKSFLKLRGAVRPKAVLGIIRATYKDWVMSEMAM